MKTSRPLVVLDLETTGTWVEKDRIIEIAMIRCMPDQTQETYERRINPGMAIPETVTKLTGICDEDVKDAPNFRDVANEIFSFLEGADFGGFNIERFDLPLLARELSDAGLGLEWRSKNIYDAQKIYHLHEKRDLTAAYQFFCNKELEGAHSAMADTRATLDVLCSQLKKYGGGKDNIEALKDFDYQQINEFYDSGRKICWWNGDLYMMFGKYARKASLKEVAKKDRGYLEWILSQNFNDDVKELVRGALDGYFPVYEEDKKKKSL